MGDMMGGDIIPPPWVNSAGPIPRNLGPIGPGNMGCRGGKFPSPANAMVGLC